MAVAAFPSCGARRLNARPWLHVVRPSASSPYPTPSHPRSPSDVDGLGTAPTSTAAPSRSFFPKQGQTLELVCESLAFKGKGVCKVADTGFVLMCDRALPGERFLGRVCGKKGNYAEMEFSFGAQRWIPGDPLTNDQDQIESGYALGLHAPRLFDKVLHIEKCLLQSEAANMVMLLSDYSSS